MSFIPPPERSEAAGFAFPGDSDDIRAEVARHLAANESYRRMFARVFPEVRAGAPITVDQFARAITGFEFTQVRADAPIDRPTHASLDDRHYFDDFNLDVFSSSRRNLTALL
jgi:di-heme cytochrome c peroxidase